MVQLLFYHTSKKPKTPETTQSPQQQAKTQAEKGIKAAQDNEAKGNTAEAINNYKQSLAEYQKAGDKAGEEAVKLQIQYLESLEGDG